jgi:hypothetical protein
VTEHVVGNPLLGGVDGAAFASRIVRDIFTAHDALIVRVAEDGTPTWQVQVSAGGGRFFVDDGRRIGPHGGRGVARRELVGARQDLEPLRRGRRRARLGRDGAHAVGTWMPCGPAP